MGFFSGVPTGYVGMVVFSLVMLIFCMVFLFGSIGFAFYIFEGAVFVAGRGSALEC